MSWELINTEAIDCTMDDSKHYTIISYAGSGLVRCDIMDCRDRPIKSFQGYFKDVRKYVVRFLGYVNISHEHASYIGEELALCNEKQGDYKQD